MQLHPCMPCMTFRTQFIVGSVRVNALRIAPESGPAHSWMAGVADIVDQLGCASAFIESQRSLGMPEPALQISLVGMVASLRNQIIGMPNLDKPGATAINTELLSSKVPNEMKDTLAVQVADRLLGRDPAQKDNNSVVVLDSNYDGCWWCILDSNHDGCWWCVPDSNYDGCWWSLLDSNYDGCWWSVLDSNCDGCRWSS